MSSTEARAHGALRSRPRWWAELPLIALVYAAYSGGRLLVAGDTGSAVAHARSILRLERILHLDPEHVINSLFTRDSWLGVPACFSYATLHYVVTPAILVWLWRRHSDRYVFMRTWLMVSTLLGLIGFTLLPTAPPRLLPGGDGFHDTLAQYASFGWWGADASAPKGMGGLTNQYAAMPSLHVGWALWCGIMLWRYARNPLLRAAGLAYPVVIAMVVLGTANHYLLDAVAGAAVMGLGLLLTRPARWLVAYALTAVTPEPVRVPAYEPVPQTVTARAAEIAASLPTHLTAKSPAPVPGARRSPEAVRR